MKTGFRLLALLALAAAALWTCAFQVAEGETVIVLRVGDPRRTIDAAGLHWKLPPPIDRVVRIDRRVHVLDPEPNEVLTSDKKNVVVDVFVAWRVADPLRFFTSVNDARGAEARLADVLSSVVGDVLGEHALAEIISVDEEPGPRTDAREDADGMTAVVDAITRGVAREAATHFGIEVGAARIKRLGFPAQNRRAVFQRMEAERAAIAGEIRSEGLEQYEKIKAAADREEARLLAEADRAARELRGAAEAEATRIYAEAYAQDPELYQFLRTLEALETVLGEDSLVILPGDHELLDVLRGPDPPAAPKPTPEPAEGGGE